MDDVKEFVKERSSRSEINDRLHVIWFCLELNSVRTRQTATSKLFMTISQFAKDVPIVVIATKKDEFMGAKEREAKKKTSKTGKTAEEYDELLCKYAEDAFFERIKMIESELLQIEGGRFDHLVGVSIDEKDSISLLTQTTAHCFSHEKVRLLYISAQVARIDLKVDLAIVETMRIYRHMVRSAAVAGFIPGGPSATRVTVAALVCKTIVACFGVPTVSPKTVQEIVSSIIWEDLGHNLSVIVAEVISSFAIIGTLVTGIPFSLVAGGINAPLVVPATTRLFLILACDVILILVKAFKDSTEKCVGQPLRKDVETAAYAYRQMRKVVHKEVNMVVPRRNMIKSFQVNKVKKQFEEIIAKYKDSITEGDSPVKNTEHEDYGDDSDTDITEVGIDEQMKNLDVNVTELTKESGDIL